jgi:hypothetical protein
MAITTIGDYAFEYSAVTSVVLGTNVNTIGFEAFHNCQDLESISMPSVTNILYGAFYLCGHLSSVKLADGLTVVPSLAFEACVALTNVSIPKTVVAIQSQAFYGCALLSSITVPATVRSIEDLAFYDCYGLQRVYFMGDNPINGLDVFKYDSLVTFYYRPGSLNWGYPAVLWNPQVKTSDFTFGIHNQQFGFTITGSSNIPVAVDVSSRLEGSDWAPVAEGILTNGFLYFSDPNWTNYSSRMYRIRAP